jgi:protein-tyrosine kinase
MIQEFNIKAPLQAGSIGKVLIEIGRLTEDQAEQILTQQKKEGARFGETAIKMGLIKESDIQFALAKQFSYSFIDKDDNSFSDKLIAAYKPYTAISEAYRAVRGQIVQRWLSRGNKVFSVSSSDSYAGSANVAANLAVVFSQLGERTLLIDANLRTPEIHEYFKLENRKGLSDILAERASLDSIVVIEKLQGLSILTAGTEAPNPQELVARPQFGVLLEQLKEYFDVIIIDTPALADYSDAQMIAVRSKGVLLVAKKDQTQIVGFEKAISELKSASAEIIGSVLNAEE